MTCVGLENYNITGIGDLMAYPTTCDYQFYAKIMGAIFIILSFGLYYAEKKKYPKPDLISCLGVGALATIFISFIGTLVGFIQSEIFIEIFVMGMILIVIWLLKK